MIIISVSPMAEVDMVQREICHIWSFLVDGPQPSSRVWTTLILNSPAIAATFGRNPSALPSLRAATRASTAQLKSLWAGEQKRFVPHRPARMGFRQTSQTTACWVPAPEIVPLTAAEGRSFLVLGLFIDRFLRCQDFRRLVRIDPSNISQNVLCARVLPAFFDLL